MTISSTTNRASYSGNGSTTVFPFPYRFLLDADLVVIEKDDTTGVETVKTLTTDYTLTGAGEASGGSVTMLTAPATGTSLIIYRDPALKQDLDLTENDNMPAEEVEKRFDKAAMWAQRLSELVTRSIRLPDGYTASFDTKLPALIEGRKSLVFNADGDGFELGPTSDEIESAQTYAEAADASADAAAASATASANSATESANSATASANSALAAQTAAQSTMWQDVVFLTNADSPVTLDGTYSGKMLACDCSSGAIVINLPEISTLDLDLPWALGVKKTDSSGNAVTVNRGGTDTIDGGTTKTIGSADSGMTLIPSISPVPDEWTTAEFGAAAGNMSVDTFAGDGVETEFTLSVDPGSENNAQVYIGGVYQEKGGFSISGTTLTFTEAPPDGVNIEVVIGTTLPIGTPSDGTVTEDKLADGAVTNAKVSDTAAIAMSKTNYAVAILKDEKTSGTAGGNFASGDWRTRVLTDKEDPESIVTLSSNQFTLTAGTYFIEAFAPAYGVDRNVLRLRNITDSTDDIFGQNAFAESSTGVETKAVLLGQITITGSKTFELQHRCNITNAAGFGLANSFGINEVYTQVKITRIK